MNNLKHAYTGCQIFDGEVIHQISGLLTENGRVTGIVDRVSIPVDYQVRELAGGLIAPGFVDLQVNGGGGVMLNDDPSLATMKTICDAHARFGTTSLLPTLITDTPQITTQAIAAAKSATDENTPGIIGLHLEGPHISRARKGAHRPDLIRTMDDKDLEILVAAGSSLSSLMVTIAPESVSLAQMQSLSDAGIVVSLGHTNANFATVEQASKNGVRCVTHLFNAMSQLENREPGVVGAVLGLGTLSAGIIADGIHVDPVVLGIALRAKRGPGKIFLVTDAMSTIGTDQTEFFLNDRQITRRDGRLVLPDGTLAGADLDMISAVRFMVNAIKLDVTEALRMASLYPAQVLQREQEIGCLASGSNADFVHLTPDLEIKGVWRRAVQVELLN
ncbi:MAG: N-acetylglucosamine-6-phosphate deacetylase [Paracoccaceae bacterium]